MSSDTLISHGSDRPVNVNGAVPCLRTFIRDRQRMLRSWRRLQRAFPPSDLAAEADATVSAMRQLHQLETEVQCHEQG